MQTNDISNDTADGATSSTTDSTASSTRNNLVETIVRLEWDAFQRTTNTGGRAACQGNWPVFHQMRASQFLTWTENLLASYRDDLDRAEHLGRNLVTEKYARMMRSTHPDEYAANIEPYIPKLSAAREAEQEAIIATQVAWAREFRERYPKLGAAMRVLTTAEDTPDATSFETYLRGELGTYSERTLGLYRDFVARLAAEHRNLTEETIANTARIAGFEGLDGAEHAQ
ncbi:DUF4125 family protein [Bifidobacterium sp. 64T4]|uniref:DUF4125 family protein n=1 Tax=Bifidobacterium pongonis TaxID=2834432 RepID=UPI001C5A4410|nr:DUF4125 family protein [Bifidobacterium pongonis]